MKVSIITVCLNSGDTIRDTIESVLGQTWREVEHIIIDGQSTDNTLKIVDEYQDRIARIVTGPDKGLYDAMNKGLSIATGDVIGILNADDFYLTNTVIAEVVASFQKLPDTDMVLGGVDFVHSGNLNRVVRKYKSIGFKPWKLRFGFMAPHPGAFVRRKAYEKVGPYKIDYQISADFDFMLRAFLVHKLKFITIDKIWVRMRLGGVSTSGVRSYKIITQEMYRSFKENSLYSNMFFLLLRFPVKLLQLVSLQVWR